MNNEISAIGWSCQVRGEFREDLRAGETAAINVRGVQARDVLKGTVLAPASISFSRWVEASLVVVYFVDSMSLLF